MNQIIQKKSSNYPVCVTCKYMWLDEADWGRTYYCNNPNIRLYNIVTGDDIAKKTCVDLRNLSSSTEVCGYQGTWWKQK